MGGGTGGGTGVRRGTVAVGGISEGWKCWWWWRWRAQAEGKAGEEASRLLDRVLVRLVHCPQQADGNEHFTRLMVPHCGTLSNNCNKWRFHSGHGRATDLDEDRHQNEHSYHSQLSLLATFPLPAPSPWPFPTAVCPHVTANSMTRIRTVCRGCFPRLDFLSLPFHSPSHSLCIISRIKKNNEKQTENAPPKGTLIKLLIFTRGRAACEKFFFSSYSPWFFLVTLFLATQVYGIWYMVYVCIFNWTIEFDNSFYNHIVYAEA